MPSQHRDKNQKNRDIEEATYLPVKTAGLDLHNPFFVGSGPTVKTVDMIRQIDQAGWGAAVIKLTIDPEPYINREPRYRWWRFVVTGACHTGRIM